MVHTHTHYEETMMAKNVRTETLPIDKIWFSPVKIREAKRDNKIYKEMTNNIARVGIYHDIIVRPLPPELANNKEENGVPPEAEYEGIDGCQRWNIAKDLNFTTIRASIREGIDEDELRALQFILNESRIPNTPKERLTQLKIISAHNSDMTQSELAKMVGKSQADISNILNLDKLPEHIMEFVASNKLPMVKAIALSKMPKNLSEEQWKDTLERAISLNSNDFTQWSQNYAKEIIKERRGDKEKADPNAIVPKTPKRQDCIQRLETCQAMLSQIKDTESNDYIFLSGKVRAFQEALCIDPETIQAQRLQKEEAKLKREQEKLERQKRDADRAIKQFEEQRKQPKSETHVEGI